MGMRDFSILTGMRIDIKPVSPYTEPVRGSSLTFHMPTAKEVTLAELHPESMDAVTAHRLSDYRHRRFSLVLLPNVHVAIEEMWELDRSMEPPVLVTAHSIPGGPL